MLRPSRYFDRREPFRVNPYASLARGAVFLGLGGGHCPKSSRSFDSSNCKNHGTLTNMDPATSCVWVPQLGRWALNFVGTNDWVNVGPNRPVVTAYPLTFAAWCRCTGAGTGYPIALADAIQSTYYWIIQVAPATYFAYQFRSGGSGQLITAGTPSTGVWYHVAGVSRASNDHVLYANGVSIGTSNVDSTPTGLDNTAIGSLQRSTPVYGAAQIADPMIWKRALSASEIGILANPADVTLSGLIVPVRRRVVSPPAGAPLTLTEDTFQNASPYNQDEAVGMVGATGGTTPYSFEIISQTLS